jgi:hypothetical protein
MISEKDLFFAFCYEGSPEHADKAKRFLINDLFVNSLSYSETIKSYVLLREFISQPCIEMDILVGVADSYREKEVLNSDFQKTYSFLENVYAENKNYYEKNKEFLI